MVALHPGYSGPTLTKSPSHVGPRRVWSPLSSARLECEDLDPLGPPLPAHPVSGAGLRS